MQTSLLSGIFICIKLTVLFSALGANIYIHWCNSGKWRHDSWRNFDSQPSMFRVPVNSSHSQLVTA